MTEENNETILYDKEVILYDADARQTIAFSGLVEDVEIEADFEPLHDERYAEYDRKSKFKVVDNGENAYSDNAESLVLLFDDTVSDVRGIPGEKPANWKDELDGDQIKTPMVARFLAVAAYAAPLVWGQTEKSVITEAYFNRETAEGKHFLRKKTVDDVKAYRQMQKIPLGAKTKGLESAEIAMPALAEKKGRIYDKMQLRQAEGYAGRVPLWHKEKVIDFIFSAGITAKK